MTEQVVNDVPEIGALTHFWTMGNNLLNFPDLNGLSGDQLARALAHRAKQVTEPGRDDLLARDYILRVHQFDPNDPITAAIANWL